MACQKAAWCIPVAVALLRLLASATAAAASTPDVLAVHQQQPAGSAVLSTTATCCPPQQVRFLGLGYPWRSHAVGVRLIGLELARRGHEFTFLAPQTIWPHPQQQQQAGTTAGWSSGSSFAGINASAHDAHLHHQHGGFPCGVSSASSSHRTVTAAADGDVPAGFRTVVYQNLDLEAASQRFRSLGTLGSVFAELKAITDNCDGVFGDASLMAGLVSGGYTYLLGDINDICAKTLANHLRIPHMDYGGWASIHAWHK